MKGRILRPGGIMEDVSFEGEPSLPQMQEIVGGYMEIVNVLNNSGEHVHMIVNEEGRIHGLPYNEIATDYYHNAIRKNLEKRGLTYYRGSHPPVVGVALLLDGRLT